MVTGWQAHCVHDDPGRELRDIRDGCRREEPQEYLEPSRLGSIPRLAAGQQGAGVGILSGEHAGDLCCGDRMVTKACPLMTADDAQRITLREAGVGEVDTLLSLIH